MSAALTASGTVGSGATSSPSSSPSATVQTPATTSKSIPITPAGGSAASHRSASSSTAASSSQSSPAKPPLLNLSGVEELGVEPSPDRHGLGHASLHTPHHLADGRAARDRTRGVTLCETPHEIRQETDRGFGRSA
eukprot:INCI10669.1.p1 GENE.INCI10669.1~~INCI10669.1.p1  ORF type:complete len:136 (-),score=10.14 INCI10669.1:400-807(-)